MGENKVPQLHQKQKAQIAWYFPKLDGGQICDIPLKMENALDCIEATANVVDYLASSEGGQLSQDDIRTALTGLATTLYGACKSMRKEITILKKREVTTLNIALPEREDQ